MTVQELISQLTQYPLDMRVMVEGYEFGFEDLTELNVENVVFDVNKEAYGGPHDIAALHPTKPAIPALILTATFHDDDKTPSIP